MTASRSASRTAGHDRDPVTDLRRIAFLLERSLASSYRVKAFRGAATALLTMQPEEIRGAADNGKLTDLKGVGEKTAAVIEQSLAGQVPDYLANLEQEAVEPLATGGEELRAALLGDCHTHSDWSDGGSPPAEMAWTAKELGHEYMVLTDHSPRLKVANGLTADRLRQQLDIIEVINQQLAPFRSSPASRSTFWKTVRSTRIRSSWPGSTSWLPACTRNSPCRPKP